MSEQGIPLTAAQAKALGFQPPEERGVELTPAQAKAMGFEIPEPEDDRSLIQKGADAFYNAELSAGKKIGGLINAVPGATDALGKVGRGIEKYSSAPARAFLAAGQNKPAISGLLDASKAFVNQFGEDPNNAPRLEDIVEKYDLKSPGAKALTETALGFLEPASLIPVEKAAAPFLKGAGKLGAAALKKSGGLIRAGADAAENAAIKGVARTGEALTSLPAKATETYLKRGPEIKDLISRYGDDVAGAADEMRRGITSDIQKFKGSQSEAIQNALAVSPKEPSLDVARITEALKRRQAMLDPKTQAAAISDIENLVKKVENIGTSDPLSAVGGTGGGGLITPKESFNIQKMLQGMAEDSYARPGEVFAGGAAAEQAAKGGARQARALTNQAIPGVADANRKLELLHRLEDRSVKGLIGEGLPQSALLEAGSTAGSRNKRSLGLLGGLLDKDYVSQAESLSAMRSFSDPKYLNPAASRSAISAAAGAALGGIPGAAIGSALTSPVAFKAAIDAGRVPVALVKQLAGVSGQLTESAINNAFKVMQTPQGAAIFGAFIRGGNVGRAQFDGDYENSLMSMEK